MSCIVTMYVILVIKQLEKRKWKSGINISENKCDNKFLVDITNLEYFDPFKK